MNEATVDRLCVFCGSSNGSGSAFSDAAIRLGNGIAAAGIDLVYGGGGSGLMGKVAKAAMANGGHVIGVMPKSLAIAENALPELNEYREVGSFHERKRLMSSLSNAFIILPGGPGTLEELCEQLALASAGRHSKPIFIINTNGYWGRLLDLLTRIDKTLPAESGISDKYVVVEEPEEAVAAYLTWKRALASKYLVS